MQWLLLTCVAAAAGVTQVVSAIEIAEIQPRGTVLVMHTSGPDTWFFIHPWPSLVGFVILMLALVPFAMFCRRADRRAELKLLQDAANGS